MVPKNVQVGYGSKIQDEGFADPVHPKELFMNPEHCRHLLYKQCCVSGMFFLFFFFC
jgi:hypothetical protein